MRVSTVPKTDLSQLNIAVALCENAGKRVYLHCIAALLQAMNGDDELG
jgi:hypothetical protein